jgi:hypothetical protein
LPDVTHKISPPPRVAPLAIRYLSINQIINKARPANAAGGFSIPSCIHDRQHRSASAARRFGVPNSFHVLQIFSSSDIYSERATRRIYLHVNAATAAYLETYLILCLEMFSACLKFWSAPDSRHQRCICEFDRAGSRSQSDSTPPVAPPFGLLMRSKDGSRPSVPRGLQQPTLPRLRAARR